MKKLFYSLFALAMTAMTFTSCEDVPAPYDDPNFNPISGGTAVIDPVGEGTLEDPYNPAGATAAVKKLTWTSNDDYQTTGDVYVKGKISRIADKGTFTEGGSYGNASFYISEDGTQNGEFYCFRILYLGNKKFESGKTDIKVGDEVIVCGQLMNYRGNTPETVAGKAYLYSLNGKTEGGGGSGTDEIKTVSIAEFNAAPESNVWYKLSGTVKNLKDGDLYGNFDLEDNTGSVYVYGLLSEKGGEKKQFQTLAAAKGIKNGVKITIIGNRGSYNDKIEVLNAYFVSVDGEGGGGSTETIGSADAPITTAKAIELINALADGGKTSEKAYVKGKIVKVATTEENFAKYGNLNYYISDDGSSTNQIQVYAGDGLNGEKFKSISDIKAGDEVVVFGVLYKYVNKSNTVIPEITDSYLVKLTEGSGGGGGTEEIKTVSIADFNAASESTSVWYKLSGTVKNLKDGDQYGNFDLEDNTGSVYVYGLLSEKGGEKKQFQTLAAAKGIKNGVKITLIGNRGSYNDKIEVLNAYFVSVDGEGGGGGDTPQGAGTYESPLTVPQAIAFGNADAAWVKGYIVGYVTGQVLSSGARFTSTAPDGETVSNTNLLIAASASEKDVTKCMPVQLSRDYRADFALDANPGMLGKEVIMAGQLANYFSAPGIKSPTYMEANGKKVGNRVKFRKRR